MTLKWCIGVFSFSLSFFAILLNLIIFMPVLRLAFVSRKSTIYIIAFFNIVSDICQLSVTCFYLSASIVADRYVITGARLNNVSILVGTFFINAWYMESLTQIVMAANRFTVITLNKNNVFTFNTTLFTFFVLILTTVVSSISMQYSFPCCLFIADHELMSYMLVNIEGEYSYSNLMIVIYDAFCTFMSTTCYVFVFVTIRNARKNTSSNVRSARNSNQDLKYLLQFVFTSIFYIFTWVLFELLPFFVPADQPQWFAVLPVLVTLNCSSNSIIYLTINREVQKSIPWIRPKQSSVAPLYAVDAN